MRNREEKPRNMWNSSIAWMLLDKGFSCIQAKRMAKDKNSLKEFVTFGPPVEEFMDK